jgi:hypothetical protein
MSHKDDLANLSVLSILDSVDVRSVPSRLIGRICSLFTLCRRWVVSNSGGNLAFGFALRARLFICGSGICIKQGGYNQIYYMS